MNLTTKQAIGMGLLKIPPAPKGRIQVNGMNKTEAEYSVRLALLKQAGDIRDWIFEGVRLKIGKGSDEGKAKSPYFTADFFVTMADGSVQLHEIKGFFRESAKLRLATAALLYPMFPFIVFRKSDGRWNVIEIYNKAAMTTGLGALCPK